MASVELSGGSGSIGHHESWSIRTAATPVCVGDSAGAVGSASVSAHATATTRYAKDNALSIVHPAVGTFEGRVSELSVRGSRADLSAVDVRRRLVADRSVGPTLEALITASFGDEYSESSLGQYLAYASDGSVFITHRNLSLVLKYNAAGELVSTIATSGSGDGQVSSPYGIALDPDGSVWVADGGNRRVQKFTTTDGVTYSYAYKFGSAGTGNGQFGSNSPVGLAVDQSTRAIYAVDPGNNRVQKFTTADSGASYSYSTKWGSSGSANGQFSSPTQIAVDASGNVYVSDAGNNRIQKFNSSGSYTTKWTGSGVIAVHGSSIYVATNSNFYRYSLTGALELDLTGYLVDGFLVRALASNDLHVAVVLRRGDVTNPATRHRGIGILLGKPTLHAVVDYYIRTCDAETPIVWDATDNPEVTFEAWEGNVWAKIKELCPAFGIELAVVDGSYIFRDIGSQSITLGNTTPATLSPTETRSGRQINIGVRNPAANDETVFWDANEQGRTLEVGAGQRITHVLATPHSPIGVLEPVHASSLPVGPGEYYVVDSAGLPLTPTQWADSGAEVIAKVTGIHTLEVTLIGPFNPIDGFTGPFKFATGVEATDTPAFSLVGPGVEVSPRTLELLTGANPETVAQQVAFSVNHPFIDTLERAYNRGVWSANVSSSGDVTVTFDIPVSKLNGLGLTEGAVFESEGSKYRIVEVAWGNLRATITATRHVTLGDVDTAWAGQSIATSDAFWSGYSFADRKIQPLLTER